MMMIRCFTASLISLVLGHPPLRSPRPRYRRIGGVNLLGLAAVVICTYQVEQATSGKAIDEQYLIILTIETRERLSVSCLG
jgi:hypothetical protein